MEIVIRGYKMSGKVQRQTYSPTFFLKQWAVETPVCSCNCD